MNVWGSEGRNGALVSDSWAGVLSDTRTERRIGDRNAARITTMMNVSVNDIPASRALRGRWGRGAGGRRCARRARLGARREVLERFSVVSTAAYRSPA